MRVEVVHDKTKVVIKEMLDVYVISPRADDEMVGMNTLSRGVVV